MHKKEFVKAVAAESGMAVNVVSAVLETIKSVVVASMQREDTIILHGFGSFSVKERKARTCRNPRTGESMKVSAKKVVRFSPGKNLLLQNTAAGKR